MALLKFKRSATPSKVPTTSDLSLGELAMNTFDGKLYMKKDDGTQAIVEIGAASGGGTWGSITGTLSNQTDLWNALSAKQDSATALTTTTSFGGDVSGTYNNIIVADDSHNHIIANVDGLQAALDGKADLTGDTFTGLVGFAGGSYVAGNGDFVARRSNGSTGVYYFVDANDKYLYWDGAGYYFGGSYNVNNYAFAATGYVQAPIFYDSDNTGNYLDPAGTSQLVTVQTSGGSGFRSFATPSASVNSQLYFADAGNTRAWNWQLDENNDAALWNYNGSAWSKRVTVTTGSEIFLRNSFGNDLSLAYPSVFGYSSAYRTTVIGNQAYNTVCIGVSPASNASGSFNGNGEGREVMFRNGVNFITPNSANNSYLNPLNMTDGYVSSSGSFRAPIFYDSDNTGYYLNPNSTSYLYFLSLAADESLNLKGIRGQFAAGSDGQGISLFSNVDIGYPSGWGGGLGNTPTRGLSVYGGGRFAYSGSGFLSADTSVRGPLFYDSNNTAYYTDPASTSVLNALTVNGGAVYRSDWTTRFQSSSDFVNGTLVSTDIPATASTGDSFVIEITGKSYDGSNPPFKVVAQGYLYNNTIIAYSGINYGGTFSSYIRVFEDGGVLKFWWPRISYWNSFNVNVMGMNGPSNGTITRNRVTSITNSVEPTGTKKQTITLNQALRENAWIGNKYFSSDGAIYGTAFYDSNNGAYYLDPNTTGNALRTAGWWRQDSTDWAGDIAGKIQYHANNWYFSAANEFIFRASNGSQPFYVTQGGVAVAQADMRAPVFYDLNNTGFYVDPNGVSVLSRITAGGRELVGQATIDMSGLDQNTYYPVTIPIPVARRTTLRIENGLNSNVPSWSTHPSGFSCFIEWVSNGSGWGTIGIDRYVNNWRESFTNVTIVGGIAQMGNSSQEIIWLRGGGTYYFSADANVTPTIRTAYYEIYGQSVEPRSTVFGSPYGSAGGKMSVGTIQTTQGADFAGTASATGDFRAPIFYDSNDTSYYCDPNARSRFVAIDTTGGTYNVFRTWTDLTGYHGLFSSVYNGAHFYPNNGSYGSWKIDGSRNGWGGLEFGSTSNGAVSLMIGLDSNTTGFHNNSYGWQFRWNNGTLFCHKGTYGAGTEATVWDSAQGSYTASSDFRAPVFYDSNNTGYYADLSVTGDSIRAAGDIVAFYSDDRLKDRGDNIANALDKVQSLNGFHYTANETAQKFGYKAHPQVGVSAQEVEAILPEVVKDAAIGHGYKTVDYAKLVPLLIEAIKELKAEVETLKKG